ncbi:hypothetical protein ASD38_20610 [Caulobacter sp. Root487D2Y]|nr:hypothetical protein ASD38_20610 [Caulobacter sp. Root487D2Y]
MLRFSVLALVFVLFSGALARAQDWSGQRDISGLTIDYAVSGAVAQVGVKLTLNGQFVDDAVLTYAAPTHNFSVAANGMSASGAISLAVVQEPSPSSLVGDFAVLDATGKSVPFKGDITTWISPDNLELFRVNYNLTGNLSARTIVLNGARYGAQVDYLTGTTLLYSSLLLPSASMSVTPFDLVIGDLKLNKGAQLTLTPPSALSNGMVVLDCTFSSEMIPPTRFTGAIASWPLQGVLPMQQDGAIVGDSKDVGTIRASLRVRPLSSRRWRLDRMVRLHVPARRRQSQQADLAG